MSTRPTRIDQDSAFFSSKKGGEIKVKQQHLARTKNLLHQNLENKLFVGVNS